MISAKTLIKKFEQIGMSGVAGLLLVVSAGLAFALANSPWGAWYHDLLATPFTIGIADLSLSKALTLWINDGLMAIFFLLVGLEIKREMIDGALSEKRKAALPVIAAIGGVVLPAGIYAIVNIVGDGNMDGWAIPAATDIAFALGILALLGSRVPVELKVFLTAVAVVDDLAAVAIIALFFTDTIATGALIAAGVSLAVLIGFNRAGVRQPVPYVIVGAVLWFAVLKSGVHATVAGVLLAATIPHTRLCSARNFWQRLVDLVNAPNEENMNELAPDTVVHRVREWCDEAESPLLRWEHAISPYVLLAVMPIFAFANAGVTVVGTTVEMGAIGWGVALGLVLGKPIGIGLGAFLGTKIGICDLPPSVNWSHIHGAAWLGGIGFTMSLFITNLALVEPAASSAKIGLLGASLVAGVVGTIILIRAGRTAK